MFRRIQRIGTVPTKYQFAVVLNSLELGVDYSGSVGAVWTRGPHKVKSLIVEGTNGQFYWDKNLQTQQPMMLVCTLYLEKDKKKIKAEPEREGPLFNSKTSRVTIKQVNDNSTKTIGEITIDLANYATAKAGQWEIRVPLEKCSDPKAMLSLTLHSRPSAVTNGAADYDTLSTMDGMDKSFIDTDSIADFTNFAEVHRQSVSASERIKAIHDADSRENSISKSQKSKKESTKDTMSDEEELSAPDAILNQFKKSRAPASTLSVEPTISKPVEPTTSSATVNTATAAPITQERSKPMNFDSDDDEDEDDEIESPANLFSKKPTTPSSTASTSSVTASSSLATSPESMKKQPTPPESTKKQPIPPSQPIKSNPATTVTPTPNTTSPHIVASPESIVSTPSKIKASNSDNDNGEISRRNTQLENQNSKLSDDNNALRRDLAMAEEHIRKLMNRDDSDVHRDCYSHEDMKSAIAQGISPLATKIKKLESALKTSDARNSELQLEIRKESQRTQQLEGELASHDETARTMIEDRESRANVRVAELETYCQSLESRIESERKESRLRSENSERVWNEKFERAISLKDAETGQLQKEIEGLRTREIRFDQVQKAKYTNDEERLKTRIAFYEEQVIEAESLTNILRKTYMATNQVLMRDVQDLENKIMESHTENAALIQEKTEYEKQIKMLEDQLRKSVENRTRLNEVVNELTVQLADKSELLGRTLNEKEELALNVDRLNKQIQRYTKNILL